MFRVARRFGMLFEFGVGGTQAQESFIRAVIRRHDRSTFHEVLWRLARKVKAERPSWAKAIPVVFQHDIGANGWTFPGLMILSANLAPGDFLEFVFLHELGHLIGRHLLNPIDKTELFADRFAYWVLAGCPVSDPMALTLVP